MNWIEVTIKSSQDKIDLLCARLEAMDIDGLVIEDEEDIKRFLRENAKYWDYIDEEFEKSISGVCRVKFYLEDGDGGAAVLRSVKAAMPDADIETRIIKNEDWENNWKQYYKPIEVGSRLLIVPQWETAENSGGRVVLRLDPGLVFGTGSHPTTKMCLEELENVDCAGKSVLDLGCGSGILAIAAVLLGARDAKGCDIDEKAPSVAMENAALNGIFEDRISFIDGDVVSDKKTDMRLRDKKYDIITANIVADAIIALCGKVADYMKDGGVFICSGIIEGRQDEVASAIEKNNLKIIKKMRMDNWYAFTCAKNGD